MLSETLEKGLRAYDIGGRIRALRLKKSMGLVALSGHTGLSPAMLSKIERGRLFPTLPTLLRIALVFSVGLEYFFEHPREKAPLAVVRRADRVRLPDVPDAAEAGFLFESLDFPVPERKLDGFYAEFLAPPGRLRMHEHPGCELLYLLRGSLAVTVADEEYVLGPGDSMYFDSSVPHGYRRRGSRPCSAVVVTSTGR